MSHSAIAGKQMIAHEPPEDALVGEGLQLVRPHGVLIPEDMVVSGAGCALDA